MEKIIGNPKVHEIWKNAPEDTWTTNQYTSDDKCCALGLIGVRAGRSDPYIILKRNLVYNINDGNSRQVKWRYPEEYKKLFKTESPSKEAIEEWENAHPKRRIMDAVAKGVL